MPRKRALTAATAAACLALTTAGAAAEPGAQRGPGMREVMIVGNNWAGTASIIDPRSFEALASGIDLVPDLDEELGEIYTDPDRLAVYLAVQQGPGEGHDQLVDDMFTTRDGRLLAVSRPSLGDVVWIDIAKAVGGDPDSIVAEESMDGYRTDHMGVSPDRGRLVVSDSTDRTVHEYAMGGLGDPETGTRLRTFESGETPHENNYTADGSRIFHASIGRVYTPGDYPALGPVKIGPAHDAAKGDRWFQIVDNATFDITDRWDMGRELAEAGHADMSSAVRPMAIAPGERYVYLQVSYFHGIVEFDTRAPDIDGAVTYTSGDLDEPRTGAVTRLIPLPDRVPDMPREQYVNDSAHHGMAIDEQGETLCAAGTMDDYVAMVDRETGSYRTLDEQTTGHYYGKPYWTTEGPGDTCWASLSDADAVAVIDFTTGEELAYLPVGDHPQRVRQGLVPEDVIG